MRSMNAYRNKKQAGFVLAVSMIFLVVMTLLAISAIKKSSMDEKIAANLRAQVTSFQAAEKALRFCERALDLAAGSTTLCTLRESSLIKPIENNNPADPLNANANFPTQWRDEGNWKGSGSNPATKIPYDSKDKVEGLDAESQPQCMIEPWPINSNGATGSKGTNKFPAWVITARSGPKISAEENEKGSVAVVWLQEIIRCGNV